VCCDSLRCIDTEAEGAHTRRQLCAHISSLPQRGHTPLHTAADKGLAAMIDILMEHGGAEAMSTFDKVRGAGARLVLCCALHACSLRAARCVLRCCGLQTPHALPAVSLSLVLVL
jgi:hypothetical protein